MFYGIKEFHWIVIEYANINFEVSFLKFRDSNFDQIDLAPTRKMTVLRKQYGSVQRRVFTAFRILFLATEKPVFAELKINTLLVKKYCNIRLLKLHWHLSHFMNYLGSNDGKKNCNFVVCFLFLPFSLNKNHSTAYLEGHSILILEW